MNMSLGVRISESALPEVARLVSRDWDSMPAVADNEMLNGYHEPK